MNSDYKNLNHLRNLKYICALLVKDSKDTTPLNELGNLIENLPEPLINSVQPFILSVFYPILTNISKKKTSYSSKEKELIVEILKTIFEKSTINNVNLFFNFYSFLLFEVYDHIHHEIREINEEYKLAIMNCTAKLGKSLSSDLILTVYSKENAPKLCQMIYVAIEIAKKEKMRTLRIAAMECIMSLGRVLNESEFGDVVVRKSVAQVFLYYLPGLSSGLKQIALEDEKVGHNVIKVALKAWGRIITLLLQDHNAADNKFDICSLKNKMNFEYKSINNTSPKRCFKNTEKITEHLKNTKYSTEWYSETDRHLQPFAVEYMKLTNHSHHEVKMELSTMCHIIIENCLTTIPKTVCNLIELIIAMSEQEDNEVASLNQVFLKGLSDKVSSNMFPTLLETLEEGFLNGIIRMPRQMNSIDENEQCSSLNLIIGYLSLFGRYKLSHVLVSGNYLQKLLNTIIQLCKLDNSNSGIIEEISSNDLNPINTDINYKKFMYIHSDVVQSRIEKLCKMLGGYGSFKIVSDFLLDVFLYEPQHRKEAVYVLNQVIMGCENSHENYIIIQDVLNTYTEDCYWNSILFLSIDNYGHQYSLNEVHNNAILVCLLVEGIGKIALILRNHFEKFTLKILYMVLEKAAQINSMVKASSLLALKDITIACGYEDISTLINENMDFFSFHIETKLHKHDDVGNVLRVLSVIMRYSSADVLIHISFILKEVLVQSCDRFKEVYATEYLQVFKTFIKCVWKWYNIESHSEPIKSKSELTKEIQHFKVTHAKPEWSTDFSDDIMGKSAEELYQEDMERNKRDLLNEIEESEVEEYRKPDPPTHIAITVNILKTSLHFLPSKNRNQKLLVLQILNEGIEVIKDWEDELLPIVHQIWSPLLGRFKEYQDPLVINYSFQLLMTLARVSKEFICTRTIKEVLPSIIESLQMFSSKSYLKDKGSAFRYSQGYKLQIEIINHLGKLMSYLNVQEESLTQVSEIVFKYLSERQPVPLQGSAITFFKDIKVFDENSVNKYLEKWLNNNVNNEFTKNVHILIQNIE